MTASPGHSPRKGIEFLDSESVIIYLDCPGANVVLLQAFFDIYEGVGIVRTLDIRESLVSILTTPAMLEDCCKVLDSIQSLIGWSYTAIPPAELKERYLGYTKKGL